MAKIKLVKLNLKIETSGEDRMGVSTKDLDVFLEIAENEVHRAVLYFRYIGFMELCQILRLG